MFDTVDVIMVISETFCIYCIEAWMDEEEEFSLNVSCTNLDYHKQLYSKKPHRAEN